MSSKKKGSKKGKGRAKKNRVSLRDQMRKRGGGGDDSAEKTSDPIGALDAEWWKNAKEADKWKAKWECMQAIMGYASGDQWGKSTLPDKFDDNKKALDVITLFSKWLMDEQHIFVRQHILKLLIPFSNSYGKTSWKKGNKIAEAIMTKQWTEKKHGFLPLVTPALIATYIASGSSLKKWKEYLVQSMDSPQGQVRMSCWDFMSKICILSTTHNKLKKQGPKDIEQFINDKNIIQYLKNTIINDKEKEVRDSCAKFIYGAKQICKKLSVLDAAYKQILEDKRASTALDLAADLYSMDKKILSGGKVSEEQLTKKVEKLHEKKKKKQASSRKNNMRAMIAQARKQAAKSGGGGAIQIAAVGGGGGGGDTSKNDENESESESEKEKTPPPKKKKTKTKKNKKNGGGGGGGGGGMKALMNKYKKDAKKPKTPDSDNDDSDNNENESKSESESDKSDETDSEEERERERLKKRQQREREREKKRKEREKEKQKQRREREKEKEREREREKEEQRKRREREKRKNKKKGKHKYSDSDSDNSDSNSDENENENDNNSNDDSSNEENYKKNRNKNKKKRAPNRRHKDKSHISESRTDTIDDHRISASSSDIQELSEKVDSISVNVQSLQNGMKGMERKMNDIAKNTDSKSGMSSKTEEKIMKILAQLQKDVKIMKNDISYIKACWEDAESVPSDGGY